MTNKERFDNDAVFNANNIQFTMTDDEVMGQRRQGVYIKDIIDNGHECQNLIFDNGHQYLYDTEEKVLYVCEPIPQEYFIHKYFEKSISDFVDKWAINESFIYCSTDEVKCGSLIRLLPYREDKIVYLPNIMIPFKLKHKGLGKLLIKEIFEICQRLQYRLVLTDVVDSFSDSLRKRNAIFLEYDMIEITNKTNLI
jgi:hypothetical protein